MERQTAVHTSSACQVAGSPAVSRAGRWSGVGLSRLLATRSALGGWHRHFCGLFRNASRTVGLGEWARDGCQQHLRPPTYQCLARAAS